jgi:Protein of unknown function (DUF3631)/Bifunctional DNA primase/polymerase, N-terminal
VNGQKGAAGAKPAAPDPLQAAALELVTSGVPVFPLRPRSKSPWAGTSGFKDATLDADLVAGWWAGRPGSNIGVPLGRMSGIVVLDIDPRHGGDKTLIELLGGRRLPETRVMATGGPDQGAQYLYRLGAEAQVRTRALGPGLELRGDGAYTVWPPSVHPETGRARSFVNDVVLAPFPELLLELGKRRNGKAKKAAPLPPLIRDGDWHNAMVSAAGRMRHHNFTLEAAVAALVEQNTTYDGAYPTDAGEIQTLVEDVYDRYPAGDADDGRAGARVVFAEPDTDALDVIDGDELVRDLIMFTRRFVVMSESQAVALAFYVIHTHAFAAASCTPYVHVSAATFESGKTRALETLAGLVRRPLETSNTSVAAVYRSIAEHRPTLLIDEVDEVFSKAKSEEAEQLRKLLNAGYTAGTPVLRCVGEGSKQQVVAFDVFGPKVLVGIGTLPRSLATRSLPVKLKKRHRGEPVERLRRRSFQEQARPLHDKCAAWAEAHLDALERAHPQLPDELSDRQQDTAEPLLAAADEIGGEWPARLRRALVELYGQASDLEDDEQIRLLADIRAVFENANTDTLLTRDLLEGLRMIEGAPWHEWWSKRVEDPWRSAQMKLARRLRPFEIRPKTVHVGPDHGKGYVLDQFGDAFARHLPPGDT